MFLLHSEHEAVVEMNKSKPVKEKPLAKKKAQTDSNQTAGKNPPSYLVDHMDLYNSAKLQFPPVFDETFQNKVACLSEREAQLLWFWEQTEGPANGINGVEIADLNMSAPWTRIRENKTPTVVSSSRMWIRGKALCLLISQSTFRGNAETGP